MAGGTGTHKPTGMLEINADIKQDLRKICTCHSVNQLTFRTKAFVG
jgi:hypothetical protein